MDSWNFPLVGPQNELNTVLTGSGIVVGLIVGVILLIVGFFNERTYQSDLSASIYKVSHFFFVLVGSVWVFGMFAYIALLGGLLLRSFFKTYKFKFRTTTSEGSVNTTSRSR